jgi:prevent-host-death family protein
MKTMGVVQAKAQLGRLVTMVSNGKTVRITRRGIPVAYLIPSRTTVSKELKRLVREIREIRQGASLGGSTIREFIDERRRY